jgi:hypothetical protein
MPKLDIYSANALGPLLLPAASGGATTVAAGNISLGANTECKCFWPLDVANRFRRATTVAAGNSSLGANTFSVQMFRPLAFARRFRRATTVAAGYSSLGANTPSRSGNVYFVNGQTVRILVPYIGPFKSGTLRKVQNAPL